MADHLKEQWATLPQEFVPEVSALLDECDLLRIQLARAKKPTMTEQHDGQLKHTRGCSAFHEPITGNEVNREACTCGLRYRIHLQTAETLLAAWQKRCQEAEQERDALRAQLANVIEQAAKVCADYADEYLKTNPSWCIHHVSAAESLELRIRALKPAAVSKPVTFEAWWNSLPPVDQNLQKKTAYHFGWDAAICARLPDKEKAK